MPDNGLRGSCLCGAVGYEVEGDPGSFYRCHCRRCRKATGTGHASNIMVRDGQLRFTRGAERVRAFKVPDAQRFTRQFCGVCGSLLPRVVTETGAVIIPAGSLDCAVSIRPQARIFWRSRAPWSCGDDDIPVFPEYPA